MYYRRTFLLLLTGVGTNINQRSSTEMFTSNSHKTLREEKEFEQRERELAKKEELDEAFLAERGSRSTAQMLEIQKEKPVADGADDGVVEEYSGVTPQGAMEGKGQKRRLAPGRQQRAENNEVKGYHPILPVKRKGASDMVEKADLIVSSQGLSKKQKVVQGTGIVTIDETVEVASREWPQGAR